MAFKETLTMHNGPEHSEPGALVGDVAGVVVVEDLGVHDQSGQLIHE